MQISALETMTYGLPIIMYADSGGADDLNDQRVTCFVDSYSDASMRKAIHAWYEKSWDSEYIQNYSKRFTVEKMAKNYLKFYEKTILEG